MVILEWGGVAIDACVSCGGVWLDRGELNSIGEQAGADAGQLTAAVERARHGKRVDRLCPRCAKKLRRLTIEGPRALELDRCPRGHGIWFDRDEMQALVESFSEGEAAAVARYFRDFFKDRLESDVKGE